MEDQEFDPIAAEKKELDLLNRNGMVFEVPRRWTGIFSKSKTRKFYIKSPPLGVLDRLSGEYIKLDLDEELIQGALGLAEAKLTVKRHARTCAKIVAIAVINNSSWYPFLVWFLTRYFYMRVDCRKLVQLAVIINNISDYTNFINSIRLMTSVRTTLPQLMEMEVNNED